MKSDLLKRIFIDFCESQNHLDSLVAKGELPSQREKVATLFSAFLRRPLTIAGHFQVEFKLSAEEFWGMNFIKLKKFSPIYDLLELMWEHPHEVPNEGGVDDFPPSMIAQWQKDWGEANAEIYAKVLSQDPLTTIRLQRRGRAAEARVLEHFKKENFPKIREGRYSPYARIFKGLAPVLTTELFKEGLYEIQDEGSQVLSLFSFLPREMSEALSEKPTTQKKEISLPTILEKLAQIKPLTVVDACAGAGGKTLALADILAGLGRVYAYDAFDKKVQSLKKRAERAQERNIQGLLLLEDPTEQLQAFHQTADVVLVDAESSKLGTLRRNADLKWNRRPYADDETRAAFESTQQNLIQGYFPLVKTGGRLVYGVSTFQKSETVDQVQWILEKFPNLALEKSGFIGPFETDGYFMASFLRR